MSVTFEGAVICAGGRDEERCYDDVFMLKWKNGEIITTSLPALPSPLADMCGALLAHPDERTFLYVAGGRDNVDGQHDLRVFWGLELSQSIENMRWHRLEPWPGPGRYHAAVAVQDGSFFLVGGSRSEGIGGVNDEPVSLRDAYRFTPSS